MIQDDKIEEAREKYDDIADDILDTVFGDESRLTRKDWE